MPTDRQRTTFSIFLVFFGGDAGSALCELHCEVNIASGAILLPWIAENVYVVFYVLLLDPKRWQGALRTHCSGCLLSYYSFFGAVQRPAAASAAAVVHKQLHEH